MTPDEIRAKLLVVKQCISEDSHTSCEAMIDEVIAYINTEARQQVAKQKDERIAELEDQASRMQFVPGHSECPKCGFYLVQSILHPNGISPNLETPQQCPNDGTEMISVSWIKHSQNMQKGQEAILERAVRAESTNAEMEKEKLNLLTCAANQAEEIQGLEMRVKELEGQHKGLVLANAFLRQRHDLPVDRIPAYEEMQKEISRLKSENEKLRKDWLVEPHEDTPEGFWGRSCARLQKKNDSLTARLSEALGALNYIYQNCDSEQERWAEETAKAIISNPDNARLLERDRLRDAVIQAAKNMMKCDPSLLNNSLGSAYAIKHYCEVKEAFEAIEAHEKEGGV